MTDKRYTSFWDYYKHERSILFKLLQLAGVAGMIIFPFGNITDEPWVVYALAGIPVYGFGLGMIYQPIHNWKSVKEGYKRQDAMLNKGDA